MAETETCAWWLLLDQVDFCSNPATTTLHHPILGDVPACDRCKSIEENT